MFENYQCKSIYTQKPRKWEMKPLLLHFTSQNLNLFLVISFHLTKERSFNQSSVSGILNIHYTIITWATTYNKLNVGKKSKKKWNFKSVFFLKISIDGVNRKDFGKDYDNVIHSRRLVADFQNLLMSSCLWN